MNQVKRLLFAYVQGMRTFEEFQLSFSDIAWDATQNYTGDDLDIIRNIELKVAEFTGGYISEDQLREAVSEIAGLSPRLVYVKWMASPGAAVFERPLPFVARETREYRAVYE